MAITNDMNIRCNLNGKISYWLPDYLSQKNRQLFEFSILQYGFLLNTEEYRNKYISWFDFSLLIRKHFDSVQSQEIVNTIQFNYY